MPKLTRAELHAIDRHVGARLGYHRKRRGMSQSELGSCVATSFQQIQKYERAANRVSASRLYAFAVHLQVPLAAMFEGLDGPTGSTLTALDDLGINDVRAIEIYARLPMETRAALRTLILTMSGNVEIAP